MASEESLVTLKILMIGPSGAGKSALLIRYCDDQFDTESSTATIGVDFKARLSRLLGQSILTLFKLKKLSVHGKAYRLNLLDTAGQERFRTLSNSYYRGAHGVILVYDISSRESFLSMEKWYDEAENNAMPGAIMYLVGSKLDKESARAVTYEEGKALANRHGSNFCEASAKTRQNVRKPFVDVVDQIVKSPNLMEAALRHHPRGSVLVGGGIPGSSGCSC